jgi:hypothetical protein
VAKRYRRIGVGLGKIAKFLTQMGGAAGRRGAIKKLRARRDELRLVLNRGKDETELVPTSYLQCFLLGWGLQGRWWASEELECSFLLTDGASAEWEALQELGVEVA